MGCGGSKVAKESVPIPSGSPAVMLINREVTTVIGASIAQKGMFSKSTNAESKAQNPGALFEHVKAAAAENLELVTAFPKFEPPEMPGMGAQMAMAATGNIDMKIKSTLLTFFRPVEPGTTLDTIQVYAPVSSTMYAKVGFTNSEIKIDASQEGITGALYHYSQQGYRLVGMGVVSGSSSMPTALTGLSGTSTGSSDALADLVFQKTGTAARTLTMTQSAIHTKLDMGRMRVAVPDFTSHLNSMGQQGYSLSGILMLPAPPPAGAGLNMEVTQPVLTVMEKIDGLCMKFCTHKFVYTIKVNMGMAGVKMGVEGDPIAIIDMYSKNGWTLKAGLSIPENSPQMGGKATIPFLLVFEAPLIVLQAAVVVSE